MLEIRDLVFGEDGQGVLAEPGADEDAGLWGVFEQRSVTIPARSSHIATFHVRVPADAEPGDHIGAVVARTTNVGQSGAEVSRQIATRLYITVPGEAQRSMLIQSVDAQYDSKLWPSLATVSVRLENDGRIRLRPEVTVSGQQTEGSAILLSRSTETYVTSMPVNWWGGLLRLPVEARADGGLTRAVSTTKVVIPWGPVFGLLILAALVYLVRRWYQTRGSTTAELREDIQRLERIVTQVATGAAASAPAGTEAADEVDEEAMLKAAWKRAQRSGDGAAMARVALGLHGLTGDAKSYVVEAMEQHDGKHRAALELALTDYEAPPAKPKPAAKKAAPKKKAVPRKPAGSAKGHKTAKRAPAKPKKKP